MDFEKIIDSLVNIKFIDHDFDLDDIEFKNFPFLLLLLDFFLFDGFDVEISDEALVASEINRKQMINICISALVPVSVSDAHTFTFLLYSAFKQT